jgi:hypothetical protein
MFTAFTLTPFRGGVPMNVEKPILDIQLRDIITRKDSLLFGIDNTIDGQYNTVLNTTHALDTTVDMNRYRNITENGTIMRLQPIHYIGGPENQEKVTRDPVEIYTNILGFSSYINDKNMRVISQMLTEYEYNMMKFDPSRLHVRSVMSRLCSLLKTYVDSQDSDDNMFLDYLLNSVRTFPYVTFRVLSELYKNTGDKYDRDNSREYEGNVYNLLPPVKEPVKSPFTTLSDKSSYDNYQTMYSSNTNAKWKSPFRQISDTKLYDSYDLTKTSFMNHSNVM